MRQSSCFGNAKSKLCSGSFALAGAAGVMIEDQTWPKRKSPALLKDLCRDCPDSTQVVGT